MFSATVTRKGEKNYAAAVAQVAPQFLEKAGAIVQTDAKRMVPVDNGDLRGSITRRVEGKTAIVGTNLEYAQWVEYKTDPHPINGPVKINGVGWRYIGMHPGTKEQPFMRPAIDQNRKSLIRDFAALIRKVLRG